MIPPASPEALAYASRSANSHVTAFGTSRERLDEAWDAMRGHFEGTYLSFERKRGSANKHTITFDSGETAVVNLEKDTAARA